MTHAGGSDSLMDRIVASPAFARAVTTLAAEHEQTVADIIELTEIPAPSRQEAKRAAAFEAKLRAHGLEDVEQDVMGNVLGRRRGTGNGAVFMLAAHLDTVFPAETEIKVRQEGTRLLAPGIGDDTRSLAMQLALLRAMDQAGIRTRSDIVFVGNVGEETDLRGSRYLVSEGHYAQRIGAFVTLDGADPGQLTIQGVGARSYRLTLRGAGGHAYGRFGAPNPAFALGRIIADFASMPVALEPKGSLNVGRIGGGTATNAIPEIVWADFEIRAPDAQELDRMDETFKAIVREAIAAETLARPGEDETLVFELDLVEDIPGGRTDEGAEIVQHAKAALRSQGFEPELRPAITDANSAMSVGIPAMMLSAGGSGGGAHTLDEWIDIEPTQHLRGMKAALAAILAVAGMELD
ncbi:Acetylornithine deacetylase/Succinyl-diaminopimelate desuccinylase [Arboricoccus pini]|uniref:Acetylornithine deacetylase/Succinyl-diaminopimelate desuccinylase n=1 Tax=Arboricoccus pini TaxID=1963835 RepID=A0A212R8Q5_9PROT|nr:M20/M25/M40 family metallo-hydrolase [Arboricoccus pini]SNB68575.1 Acetylornithine deacetylase/Succinyl-diaminopimelate desuccinylase [Arboricoccus pini]